VSQLACEDDAFLYRFFAPQLFSSKGSGGVGNGGILYRIEDIDAYSFMI
jgi:hypothetical protein